MIEVGHTLPNIGGEERNNTLNNILNNNIKFNGSGDSMIAGELLSLLSSDGNNLYTFLTFDKEFGILFQQACDVLNLSNLEVTTIV